MCGIVGYIGHQPSAPLLLKGLKNLEYRGYDSAGVALFHDQLELFKTVGLVDQLVPLVHHHPATVGIGHTRWATHGVASEINAHPHLSFAKRFVVVHNGTIENYQALQEAYLAPHKMQSQTDTEVLAGLFDAWTQQGLSLPEAIVRFMKEVEGSYAMVVMDQQDPATLYAIKNRSPLLIGLGDKEQFIVSDATALADHVATFYVLEDLEYAVIQAAQVELFDQTGHAITKALYQPYQRHIDRDLGIFDHYMQKEIEEQPTVIRRLLKAFHLDPKIRQDIIASQRVYIIASGTSYHAGLVGKHVLESILQIPTEVHLGSEFAYFPPLLVDRPFFIFLSQSGETADSVRALDRLKPLQVTTLSMTNGETSTLARDTTYHIYLHAGIEIAVASTKAYTAQIAALVLLANTIQPTFDATYEFAKAALVMEEVLSNRGWIQDFVQTNMNDQRAAFFIGRGVDYALAQEAALKLKEVSYIQAEGFAAAELKHGTIALIEPKTPVIALVSDERAHLTRGNVMEVLAREAVAIIISMKDVSQPSDDMILPSVHPMLRSLVMALPMQYIAYYAALDRGHDIDKPRNLAKSVTVE
jgi:glucosamine--fructose-6-phosphate aminotransferase (isomerizing)